MDRTHQFARPHVARPKLIRLGWFVLLVPVISMLLAPAVAAQYEGVAGLFVSQEPDDPHNISIEGSGCEANSQVVLYLPGIAATNDDPDAAISVPGRVIAVTTALSSDDPTVDGTFSVGNIELPADLLPNQYAIHARCGDQDLASLFVIPTPAAGSTTTSTVPTNGQAQLPLTGASSQRGAALAAALMGLGAFFVVAARKTP